MKDCLGGSSQSTSAFKSSKKCKYDVNAVRADYKGYISEYITMLIVHIQICYRLIKISIFEAEAEKQRMANFYGEFGFIYIAIRHILNYQKHSY